ncbi:hypothetical protein ANO11243_087680 [Dothideomycetidae sp. 11243]|nr:hypothetical protein ANO11243_087680 [fungal sp. No.11243]
MSSSFSTTNPAQKSEHTLAVLDDYLSLSETHFSSLPIGVSYFPSTLHAEHDTAALVARLQPYNMISSMRERTAFPATILAQLPNLKLLLTTGVRNASIDMSCCKERGIVVAGTKGTRHGETGAPPPGYASTTQHALSLLLALTSRVAVDDAVLKNTGGWQSGPAIALAGKTLGVVGLGKLGGAMARSCILGLGMRCVAWSASLTPQKVREVCDELGLPEGSIACVGKEELFAQADVVSVHYVLSQRSRGIVGREDIAKMKSSAILVNTARGPLVDEDALFEALDQGRIYGAALDVYWGREPLEPDSRWRTTPWGRDGRAQVVLSPHMGYVNKDTMETWYAEQAADVRRFIEGQEVGLRLA